MKLDRIALRALERAYRDTLSAPADLLAHARFAAWARLVSRIVGVPFVACTAANTAGRQEWVRITACTLFAVLAANYGLGIYLRPDDPPNPSPPRTAFVSAMTSTATDTGVFLSNIYVNNTTTGAQIRFPLWRPASVVKSK